MSSLFQISSVKFSSRGYHGSTFKLFSIDIISHCSSRLPSLLHTDNSIAPESLCFWKLAFIIPALNWKFSSQNQVHKFWSSIDSTSSGHLFSNITFLSVEVHWCNIRTRSSSRSSEKWKTCLLMSILSPLSPANYSFSGQIICLYASTSFSKKCFSLSVLISISFRMIISSAS